MPLVLVGLLIVGGCALGFAVVSLQTGGRAVLVVSRDLQAGSVLTAGDLAVVHAEVPPLVQVIGDAERESVIGRTVSVPLPARSLLTRQAVAARMFPPGGHAVLGVALRPGRFPPVLVAGARVQAFRVAAEQQGAGTPPPPPPPPAAAAEGDAGAAGGAVALPITTATVLKVETAPGGEGTAVVELQLPDDDVPQVAAAAAAGVVTLVLVAAGG